MAVTVLGFDIPMWLMLTLVLLVIFYKYTMRNSGIFKAMGVKGPPVWPVVGNNPIPLFKSMAKYDLDLLDKYGKVVGTFFRSHPFLVVADLDMLKDIQVKEFQNFTNHFTDMIGIEKPLDKMLPIIKDDAWRNIRNTVTPTFSGGKLRRMNKQMNRCSQLLVESLSEKARLGEPVDVKDHAGAYAMDLIASTAFGLDIDSQKDPNDPFITHAKSFDFTKRGAILLLLFVFPFLQKFGIEILPKETINFFSRIVDQAMASRTSEDKEKRADFLQLMINAHQEDADEKEEENQDQEGDFSESGGHHQRKRLTRDEVLAQGFIFFNAGYSTVSDAMCSLLYVLATNPDVQVRLYEDIVSANLHKTDPTYDSLNKLHYLDMVIHESLRLYPPALRTDRDCNRDSAIGGIQIPKGMTITIPVYAIHMNPEIWSEPERFDPERFSPEEKAQRHPYAFQAFGQGPRSCIGMRLALMELKMALVHIIRAHNVVPCEKTNIPMKRSAFGQPMDVFIKFQDRT